MTSAGGALGEILWRKLVPALGLVCGVVQICWYGLRMQVKTLATFTLKLQCIIVSAGEVPHSSRWSCAYISVTCYNYSRVYTLSWPFQVINLPMISLVKSWGLKPGLGVGWNGQCLYTATWWCQEAGHGHPCLPGLKPNPKPRSVGWRFGEVVGVSRKLDRSDVDGERIFLMVWCNPNL